MIALMIASFAEGSKSMSRTPSLIDTVDIGELAVPFLRQSCANDEKINVVLAGLAARYREPVSRQHGRHAAKSAGRLACRMCIHEASSVRFGTSANA